MATHKGGGDVCRQNFQEVAREEERQLLYLQYDPLRAMRQLQMLQCSYAPST